jgi:peroxiredoxin Q/BCP
MTTLRVGDRAPDFSLPSSSGTAVRLSQFLGKNIVIFFYPMDESPVCSRQAEAFRNRHTAFKALDAEVIGVSSQSVESHKSFARHHNLSFILLSDKNNSVRKLYGIPSTLGIPGRVTFVIDKRGILFFVYSSQIRPAKHADEALRALREISNQK